MAEFDSDLCGLTAFSCFPQPGLGTDARSAARSDHVPAAVHEPRRLTRRSSATSSPTSTAPTTAACAGSSCAGRPAAPGRLHQEGTYAIDADNRWMARQRHGPVGQHRHRLQRLLDHDLPQPALHRPAGRRPAGRDDPARDRRSTPAPSSNSSNRYGDYAAMSLDPADDCTFWFTGMDNTSSNWRTQIASFALRRLRLRAGAPAAADVDADRQRRQPDRPELGRLRPGDGRRVPGPALAHAGRPLRDDRHRRRHQPRHRRRRRATSSTTPTSAAASTYYYIVVASDGAACKSDAAQRGQRHGHRRLHAEAAVRRPARASRRPSTRHCTLDLAWSPAQRRVRRTASTYNVYRSTDPGLHARPGQPAGRRARRHDLHRLRTAWSTATPYYYIVRAVDQTQRRRGEQRRRGGGHAAWGS